MKGIELDFAVLMDVCYFSVVQHWYCTQINSNQLSTNNNYYKSPGFLGQFVQSYIG